MKGKKKVLYCLSLFGLALGLGLTACGGSTETGGEGAEGTVTYGDGSNFLAWVGKTTGTGDAATTTRLDSGQEVLLTSGEDGVSLNGYDVPQGYTLSFKAEALDGGPEFRIDDEGAASVPVVTEDHTYKVTVSATGSGGTVSTWINVTVVPKDEIATGAINYSNLTGEEKLDIMQQLDGYTIYHGLSGVTLRSNGSYQLYQDRVTSPLLTSNNYIMGYGWGVLDYGNITAAMDSHNEEKENWRYYYHTFTQDDPGHLNAMNASESEVDDVESYIRSSYFTYRLNESYTAKEQVGVLSRENDAIALNKDATGKATKWKVKLRVGADADGDNGETKGLTYRTASTDATLGAFNGRKVALDDYLTPWKLLLTQAVGWSRGSEQVSSSNPAVIVGSADYYNATADGFDEKAWDKVGITIDETDNSITFELTQGVTQDFIAYYLDSYTSNPIPMDFIKDLATTGTTDDDKILSGAKNYATFIDGKSPVDTHLSVGPYYLEYYEKSKSYVYKKNADWFEKEDSYGRTLYQIPGIKLMYDQSINEDASAWYNAYYAGRIDVVTIPSEQWEKEKTNTKKKEVPGSSSSNLRLNTSDELLYSELFGKDGRINRARELHTTESSYYQVKPIMSNRNFIYGLNTSIDREDLCDTKGYTASSDYFGDLQQMSPASTVSYNKTDAHQSAVASVYGENGISLTDNIAGYTYFQKAIEEELAAGHYTLGTGSNPTVVSFSIKATDSRFNSWYSEVASLWEKAFSDAVLLHGGDWVDGSSPKIVLDVEQLTPSSTDSTTVNNFIFYEGQMVGDFDSGIGYITGGAYDTFNFMRLQRAYNDPAELVLTWGADTSLLSPRIKYEGKYYSYDGLWLSGQQGVILDTEGTVVDPIVVGSADEFALDAATGKIVGTLTFTPTEGVTVSLDEASAQSFYINDPDIGYFEFPADFSDEEVALVEITVDNDAHTITYSIDPALIEEMVGTFQYYHEYYGLGDLTSINIIAVVSYTVYFDDVPASGTLTYTFAGNLIPLVSE
jgi:hypothetical protein